MMAAPRPEDSSLPTSRGLAGAEMSTKCADWASSGTTATRTKIAMPAPWVRLEARPTCCMPVVWGGNARAGTGWHQGGIAAASIRKDRIEARVGNPWIRRVVACQHGGVREPWQPTVQPLQWKRMPLLKAPWQDRGKEGQWPDRTTPASSVR